MKPVHFPESNAIFAKDQPEYLPLPSFIDPNDKNGSVVFCWELTFKERLKLLFTGKVWVSIWTFKNPLQPSRLTINKSEVIDNGIL
jgi:hypothetical protein